MRGITIEQASESASKQAGALPPTYSLAYRGALPPSHLLWDRTAASNRITTPTAPHQLLQPRSLPSAVEKQLHRVEGSAEG